MFVERKVQWFDTNTAYGTAKNLFKFEISNFNIVLYLYPNHEFVIVLKKQDKLDIESQPA